MKSIKLNLILLIGMISLVSVSCSNETEQTKTSYSKDGDSDKVLVDKDNPNYDEITAFNNELYAKYKFQNSDGNEDIYLPEPGVLIGMQSESKFVTIICSNTDAAGVTVIVSFNSSTMQYLYSYSTPGYFDSHFVWHKPSWVVYSMSTYIGVC